MSMTILDIVILALMVLAAIFGLIRGGKRRFVKWIATIAGLVVAIYFYQMLGNLIVTKAPFADSLAQTFADKLPSDLASINFADISEDAIKSGFSEVGIPKFFISYFYTKIFIRDGTLALAIGSSFAGAIIYACCFVLLFFAVFTVLTLIVHALIRDNPDGHKTFLDRFAGMVFSEAKMICFIFVVMLILVGISYAVPSLDTWLKEQVQFGSDKVGLSGWFYNTTWQIINAFKDLIAK